jgi:hypothetical protein
MLSILLQFGAYSMGVMFLLFIIFVEMKHLKLTIGPQILHPETIMERLGINWEVSMPKYIWLKKLWADGNFDAVKMSAKRAGSVRTEVMDEDNTYKKVYPDEYKEMIKNPLKRTKFKTLVDELDVEYFDCDATEGFVVINRYSVSDNDMELLISKILKENA